MGNQLCDCLITYCSRRLKNIKQVHPAVLRTQENGSNRRKISRGKGENRQQTQPTYGGRMRAKHSICGLHRGNNKKVG